ncbi:MAG: extensin family protein [Hyphomicrobium sp.]|nr:extensin family protein [Hyphomicrobium sp.]
MRRSGRNFLRALLALLLLVIVFGAFWFGLVPQRYSPFAPISLDDPPTWFVDFRLAALRRDPEQCRAVLLAPHIVATPIADKVQPNGCGWTNAVRVAEVGGAQIGLEQLTCEAATALALWIEYQVQPLAVEMFGSRVAWMQDMGTYSCRNIIGNKRWMNMRSQHSLANAVDIGAFRLANGKQISITKDYKADSPEGRFLREAHMRACGYFRVAIGPQFNAAHKDHLHLDRGILTRCQ